MAPLRVAVLDDYQGFSKPYFAKLDPAVYDVTIFNDTLPPYNHPDTTDAQRDELVSRLNSFDIICTMRERTPFPEPLITRLPTLKLLLTTSRRNNSLALPALQARSIPVAGTLDNRFTSPTEASGPDSTTQHCVALILALARDVPSSHTAIRSGLWQTSLATSLPGKVFATVGLGRLGISVARIMMQAFGMRVIAWSQNLTQEKADEQAREANLPIEDPRTREKTFKVVSREECFAQADVLSVHLVLSDRSRGLITRADLERMKPTAFLVNTSRGPLVREGDLLGVLKEGRIAGAALDVFDLEPLPGDSEWRTVEWGVEGRSRVVLTPHMGYVQRETMAAWYAQQVENVERWRAGEELLARFV